MGLFSTFEDFSSLREEYTNLIRAAFPVDEQALAELHLKTGGIKFIDALILRNLLKEKRPKKILEIGSYIGFSTSWLLRSSYEWSAHVTAIDPGIRIPPFLEPHEFLDRALHLEKNPRLQFIRGFFAAKPEGYNQNEFFKDLPLIDENFSERFDFIFIDGAHDYKSVRGDFELAKKLLNPDGIIAFHDIFAWPDVAKVLSEIEASDSGRLVKHGKIFHLIPRALKYFYDRLRNDSKINSSNEFQMRPEKENAILKEKDTSLKNKASQILIRLARNVFYDLWFDGVASYRFRQ